MEDHHSIEEDFLQFYTTLLGSTHTSKAQVSQTIINEGAKINTRRQVHLCVPFNGEDVKIALFDIDDDKTPRMATPVVCS